MDVGPGDWVEFVDDSPNPLDFDNGARLLMLGAIYVVEAIISASEYAVSNTSDGFELVGVNHIGPDGWRASFRCDRFRPIRDGQERISKPEKVMV